ncbi:MAG: amidohydrolase family protein [Gemmatimonadota bacterium]|nr:amidohydrolase family protein [Gemmatimonadota bacterium]
MSVFHASIFALIAWHSLLLAPGAPTDPDSGILAIQHVTVVDVEAGKSLPDRTVLVRDGTIAAIGPAGSVPIPEEAARLSGRGRWLIPGLWDMHVHVTDATALALPALVAHGVTGVRDAGGDLVAIDAWRRAIASGELAGPRIVRPGPYVDGYKPDAPFRLTVEDADDARAAVAYVQARGADYVKIHNAVPREAYFALAGESRERGIPFAGHVPLDVSPGEAARAGQASLEHAVTIFEGTFRELLPPDPEAQMRTLAAFVASGADTLAARLRAEGTAVTPTLAPTVLRGRRVELADDPPACADLVARSLREQWDRFFPVTERDRAPGVEALRARFADLMIGFTGVLHAAGVPLLAGSDLGARDVCPGVALHDELAHLVGAGLEPLDALRAATIVPARFLGASDSLGSVATGKRADLVLLEADPLADIGNTRRIFAVIADGKRYDRGALDAILADVRRRAAEEGAGR